MCGAQTRQHEFINPLVTAWKEKEYFVPFVKMKAFFLFKHASSPFPLETSGSFFKFNSFLLLFFFKLNLIFYLFIRSLH